MPDKRPLDGPDSQAPSKRAAPTSAATTSPMSDERIIAVLKHPRVASGSSSSPFSAPPLFQQPAPLCSFSFDEHRKQWQDDRCKRYYRGLPPYNNRHPHQNRAPPVFGADLNYGLERFVRRDDAVPEHLDALVAALQHRTEAATSDAERNELDAERRKADVVTWRGIVTKICTAYEQSAEARFSDPLELNAMMLDGTLYLEEYTSATAMAEKQQKEDDAKMLRMGYYGYSFESYCTVDTEAQTREPFRAMRRADTPVPDPPGWSGDVNTNVQWCQVVKTKLGSNRLVIGGEVDAVERNSTTGREELVELKTSVQMTSAQRNAAKAAVEQERFEKKLLKFFLQSYLLGIGKIVVGFRDYHGFLTTHQDFETLRIPRMVRAGQPIAGRFDEAGRPVIRDKSVWEPKDGLGFGDQILSFIRQTISTHSSTSKDESSATSKIEHPVFRVTFKAPFEAVEIRALSQQEVLEQAQDGGSSGERVGFLPRSFYDFVQTRARPSTQP
ncbi:related to RAI1-Rat1p Interacting Protein, required for pre-rRNA processing [Sporisorium reilianum SRZ2]|uniref:Decapping nuclease n=1 Tax=Sporisorium reilianum (strain SRZ2) TaxID=999809 RepID=E7A024_SPORE|nr:related to RAI1-Rat1p Interacting Protein, required for pre-rRNA processing [Sporisorium reilianum SRZ2]